MKNSGAAPKRVRPRSGRAAQGDSEALGTLHDDPQLARRLRAYAEALLEKNASLNLTGARTPAAVAAHVRDSLLLAEYVADPLVDVGSGGGFPAIPLVIATGCRATLIESTSKKARFLEELAEKLALPVRVVGARAESAAHDPTLRGAFATVTARAVGSLPTVLELTLPFLAVGGHTLLQRGTLSRDERDAGMAAALLLGGGEYRERQLDGTRRLCIVTKRANTDSRFPRRSGMPAKHPLMWDVRGAARARTGNGG